MPSLILHCQLKRLVVLKPELTLSTRTWELDTASSEIVEELKESTDTVSKCFPLQPPLKYLHIIAKVRNREYRYSLHFLFDGTSITPYQILGPQWLYWQVLPTRCE